MKITKITELLPESLDQSTVEKIAALIDSTINEQVSKQVNVLSSKVRAFLRSQIDQIKEHALEELSEESEVFRNAKLFESVRSLMSLEISSKDEQNALTEVVSEKEELEEQVLSIAEQLENTLTENEKLKETLSVVSNRLEQLESLNESLNSKNRKLLGKVNNLKAINEESFLSSEKALVVSKADRKSEDSGLTGNQLLSEEVMRLMPFSKKN